MGLAYQGSNYVGSQLQRDKPTIQLFLQRALSAVADQRVTAHFAGRTDSGVHATQMVVSFESTSDRTHEEWIKGTSAYLPDDIQPSWISTVPPNFDARYSALRRRYFYVVGKRDSTSVHVREAATWTDRALDAEAMREATQFFLGEQDLSSFCAASDMSRSKRRDIQRLLIVDIGDYMVIDITANAFLYKMARNIAGCLLAVGYGQLCIDDVPAIIDKRDRRFAPKTAPAQGLYLVQVEYEMLSEQTSLQAPKILGPNAESFFDSGNELVVSFQRSDHGSD